MSDWAMEKARELEADSATAVDIAAALREAEMRAKAEAAAITRRVTDSLRQAAKQSPRRARFLSIVADNMEMAAAEIEMSSPLTLPAAPNAGWPGE